MVLDEIAEESVSFIAHWGFQRYRMARDIHDLQDFRLGQIGGASDLGGSRFPLENLLEPVRGFPHPVDRFTDMDWQADGAALVGDRPGDRLANPPCGIRAELEAALVVELVGGLHQTDVAFLNQIEEGKPASDIALGHGDDQPEICLNQVSPGSLAISDKRGQFFAPLERHQRPLAQLFFRTFSGFHAASQVDFTLHGEQIGFADLLEVETDGVADARLLIGKTLTLIDLRLVPARSQRRGSLLQNFDTFGYEGGIEIVEVCDMLFHVGKERHNVVCEHEPLIAAFRQEIRHHPESLRPVSSTLPEHSRSGHNRCFAHAMQGSDHPGAGCGNCRELLCETFRNSVVY
jgi:hypothetical protein